MFGLWLFCALLRISRLVDRGVTSWYGGCVAYAMRDGVWNTPLCHSFWMAAEARLLGVS